MNFGGTRGTRQCAQVHVGGGPLLYVIGYPLVCFWLLIVCVYSFLFVFIDFMVVYGLGYYLLFVSVAYLLLVIICFSLVLLMFRVMYC